MKLERPAKIRTRTRPRLLVLLAMIHHAIATGHPAAYDSQIDGLEGYIVCRECGKRLLYARIEVKDGKR